MALIIESVMQLFKYVKDRYSSKEFLDLIEKEKEESGGLLNDCTAAAMVLYKDGIEPMPARLIGAVREGEECVVPCCVDWISDVNTFQRRGGGEGGMMNMIVSDSLSKGYLTVWNTRVVDNISSGMIQPNDHVIIHRIALEDKSTGSGEVGKKEEDNNGDKDDIEIRLVLRSGAYISKISKEEFDELEERLARFDALETKPNLKSINAVMSLDNNELKYSSPTADIKGTMQDRFGPRQYESKGRKFKMGKLKIFDGTGSIWVVLWEPASNIMEGLELGNTVVIESGRVKLGLKGEKEIQVSKKNQIKKDDYSKKP